MHTMLIREVEVEVEIKKREWVTKKINIIIPKRLNDWYKDTAEEIGISKTALMTIALNQYKVENEKSSQNLV